MENEELDLNGTADDETGSDELLADDNLRLPDSANVLVRLHAVRAWLERRHEEATMEVGTAAIALQSSAREETDELRPRRRQHSAAAATNARVQQQLVDAQQRMGAIEVAQELLEEVIAHTNGERALVEYYLALEQLILENGYNFADDSPAQHTPWFDEMVAVLQRIEHVGTPQED